jgi:UDP-N-acetylmuramoyl-tripeptide--D-alanyl-D-alanine ligase
MVEPAPLWTSREILSAVGGEAYGGPFACTGVSIDTRTLAEGDLFVALTGARDGEAFVDAALARGAGGLLTRKAHPAPGIRTEAPLAALEPLRAAGPPGPGAAPSPVRSARPASLRPWPRPCARPARPMRPSRATTTTSACP